MFVVSGEEVNWVQCDSCEKWFHLLCVGLAEDEVSENEDYVCFVCKHQPKMTITETGDLIEIKDELALLAESAEEDDQPNGSHFNGDLDTGLTDEEAMVIDAPSDLPARSTQLVAAKIGTDAPVVHSVEETLMKDVDLQVVPSGGESVDVTDVVDLL